MTGRDSTEELLRCSIPQISRSPQPLERTSCLLTVHALHCQSQVQGNQRSSSVYLTHHASKVIHPCSILKSKQLRAAHKACPLIHPLNHLLFIPSRSAPRWPATQELELAPVASAEPHRRQQCKVEARVQKNSTKERSLLAPLYHDAPSSPSTGALGSWRPLTLSAIHLLIPFAKRAIEREHSREASQNPKPGTIECMQFIFSID